MSVLEELYEGKIHPWDKFVVDASEYQVLSNQLGEYLEELIGQLNDRERELCNKMEDIIADLSGISQRECFIEGFRIGAQVMWDIYQYKSKNFY